MTALVPAPGLAPDDDGLARSARFHLRLAGVLVLALLGGLGGWAALTEISAAVIAPGRVAVESAVKLVQHREGGIVREITVHEGDEVAAGDLLVRLDDTEARTNLAMIVSELTEARAQYARLVAERDGADTIAFSPSGDGDVPKDLADIEAGEALLLRARQAGLAGRRQQIEEQIRQIKEQISGLEAQRAANQHAIDLLDEELSGLVPLLDKKFVTKTRVTTLQRDKVQLEGEQGELIAKVASLRQAISEKRLQILQIDEENRAEILQELKETRAHITQLEEQKVAAQDALRRVEIRAPRTGTVHELAVHTIGGVVRPGETLLQIVPQEDVLVVEGEVAPADIDRVFAGQEATIRFPGLDHRTTPKLAARVETVAADLTVDEATHRSFYTIRLTIRETELARLDVQKLVSGMPAEAFVTVGSRTVLAYLVKPIADQIAHAMREG
jgi:HlyD family type I secretion membrane fusion protein